MVTEQPPLPPVPEELTKPQKRRLRIGLVVYGCAIVILVLIVIINYLFERTMYEGYYKYMR